MKFFLSLILILASVSLSASEITEVICTKETSGSAYELIISYDDSREGYKRAVQYKVFSKSKNRETVNFIAPINLAQIIYYSDGDPVSMYYQVAMKKVERIVEESNPIKKVELYFNPFSMDDVKDLMLRYAKSSGNWNQRNMRCDLLVDVDDMEGVKR